MQQQSVEGNLCPGNHQHAQHTPPSHEGPEAGEMRVPRGKEKVAVQFSDEGLLCLLQVRLQQQLQISETLNTGHF